MKRRISLYQWGVLIRPQRHHIRLYGVFVLLVYSFTYLGCLRPGSSGSPGGSDSPGYLSPDHPHPGSATLLSPRIIQPDYIPRQSGQARILVTAPLVADISTLQWEMKRRLSLYQWGVLIRPQRHHIRLYGVFVLLVYSFTYLGCLRPGSSGSPGGSDSPGYLSPDHPHRESATLIYIYIYFFFYLQMHCVTNFKIYNSVASGHVTTCWWLLIRSLITKGFTTYKS